MHAGTQPKKKKIQIWQHCSVNNETRLWTYANLHTNRERIFTQLKFQFGREKKVGDEKFDEQLTPDSRQCLVVDFCSVSVSSVAACDLKQLLFVPLHAWRQRLTCFFITRFQMNHSKGRFTRKYHPSKMGHTLIGSVYTEQYWLFIVSCCTCNNSKYQL